MLETNKTGEKMIKLLNNLKPLEERQKELKEELKKFKDENEMLRVQSFAIDLKNGLIDYFIYFNKDHYLLSSFIGIKIIGSLTMTSVKRQSFYDFCIRKKTTDEFRQIDSKFNEFTKGKLSLNNRNFEAISQERHHSNIKISDFDYNLSEFLPIVKNSLDNMDSQIKSSYYIDTLFEILEVTKNFKLKFYYN